MILTICGKYQYSRTCHVFLSHYVTFSICFGKTLSITANNKQQQVVLVYV